MQGTYKVYHNVHAFNGNHSQAPEFVLVAEVETDHMETAYFFTNSIDFHWSEHPEVTTHGEKTRSTSVGDRIESPDGTVWAVAPAGFKEVVESAGYCAEDGCMSGAAQAGYCTEHLDYRAPPIPGHRDEHQ